MKKFDNYRKNLDVLRRSDQQDLNNEFIISGIIDKFSIQFELGWKVLKELLTYEGINAAKTGSPREIIKQAYQYYWDNGTIPWIGSNMCQDTILIKNDGKFITEEGYIHSSAKWFYKGTVLVALVGATIGKTALLRFDTTTNQNIAAIDVNGNAAFSSEFVFYHMQMLYAKFMEIGNGKFKMANQGFIRQLPLVCPPLALQQRFAAFVEQADKSKVTIQKALDEAQLLFDSLMQKYFG